MLVGATLLLEKPMLVLRGFGFGGRAGGVPLACDRFVGCIVGKGLRRLETHDTTLDGKGFLPSTMRDVDAE